MKLGKRIIEGLIVIRAWNGERKCKGCKVTELEMQEEEETCWNTEQTKEEVCQEFRKLKDLNQRPNENTRATGNLLVGFLMFIAIVNMVGLKSSALVEEHKTVKWKKCQRGVEVVQLPKEQNRPAYWLRSGVG